jgi:hypothetical protein
MGGPGSGRRSHIYGKKRTVESALVLDVDRLIEEGLLRCRRGVIQWKPLSLVNPVLMPFRTEKLNAKDSCLRLDLFVPADGPNQWIKQPLYVGARAQQLGGFRHYFYCPALGCLKRVRRLYLPYGCGFFACRKCYCLTYRSVQEHDKRMDQLRRSVTQRAAYVALSPLAVDYFVSQLFNDRTTGFPGKVVCRGDLKQLLAKSSG